jgi:hypothetical protein
MSAELARHELEQDQRRLVGGMQILEHHQQGHTRGSKPEGARYLPEQGESCLRKISGSHRRRVWKRHTAPIERLAPWPERGRAARLPAPSPRNPNAASARDVRHFGGEPRLADPRFAREEIETAPALDPRQRGGEFRKLPISSDEHGLR